jgi:hypothetical protein
MSIFKVSPENRNLDYYLEMYNSNFVANDSLEVIQLYYYLYENVDVYTGELYILEKHKPDLDGFCKGGGRPLFRAMNVNKYYYRYVRNTTTDEKEIPENFYNPITLLENDPKIYIADGFGKDILRLRSIIWNDTYINGVGNNINFNMLMLAYKLGDIKHLLSPIKGITQL